MAEYVVSYKFVTTGLKHYEVFNTSDSIKNREEAMKLYSAKKADKRVWSVVFSKIIESHKNK